MAIRKQPRTRKDSREITLGLDEALIALFIGAMNANEHLAADEASRAQHLIATTRRFRRKSGETVGKMIHDVYTLLEQRDADAVMDAAARAIPTRLRPSAFAVLADLLLADGKIEPAERRFLQSIGSRLAIAPALVRQVVDVVLLKNGL